MIEDEIKNLPSRYDLGYAAGYDAGFKAGMAAGQGVHAYPARPYNPNEIWGQPKGYTCPVCNMFFEAGKAYGYCCMNSNCPTRVSCSSNVSYSFGITKIT